MTYQRLRQICNSDCKFPFGMIDMEPDEVHFLDEVPSFQLSSPGDNCGDQLCMSYAYLLSLHSRIDIIDYLASCCCNSVAWALSNLCRKYTFFPTRPSLAYS